MASGSGGPKTSSAEVRISHLEDVHQNTYQGEGDCLSTRITRSDAK